MYNEEYNPKEYLRRQLGIKRSPPNILSQEYLSNLFPNNKNLLNPTQFPPSESAN